MVKKQLPPSLLTLKKTQVGDPLAESPDAAADGSRVLPINQLVPDPANPRRTLRDLDGLAESMRARGVLQPLTVRPADEGDGTYVIVMGHRRHAAATLAGLTEVPVIVQAMTEPDRLEAMLMENLLRDDLNPLEEARGYKELAATGRSQRQMAERLGRSQSHVSKRLSLLKLPPSAQDALDSGGITVEEALALLGLVDHVERLGVAVKEVLDLRARGESPNLEWVINRELREVEREQRRTRAAERLKRDGVRLVEDGNWHQRTEQQLGRGYHQMDIAVEAHAGEPCHAAAVDEEGEVLWVCTEPSRHASSSGNETTGSESGDHDPAHARDEPADSGTALAPPSRAAKVNTAPLAAEEPASQYEDVGAASAAGATGSAAQANVERMEQSLRARRRRAEAMQGLLQGKVTRGGSVDFVLRQGLAAMLPAIDENRACELLGLDSPTGDHDRSPLEVFADAGPEQLLRAALAVVLVYGEEMSGDFRLDGPVGLEVVRHLTYLQRQGYSPADVEREALASSPHPGQYEQDTAEEVAAAPAAI